MVLRVTPTCPWTLHASGTHVYCMSTRKTTQKYKLKLTHSLRRRGYGVGPTQKYILGFTPPQNENFVINHLPPCRSKTIKALFVFGTQFKIFWMKTGRLVTVPLTAKQLTLTVKVQKVSFWGGVGLTRAVARGLGAP